MSILTCPATGAQFTVVADVDIVVVHSCANCGYRWPGKERVHQTRDGRLIIAAWQLGLEFEPGQSGKLIPVREGVEIPKHCRACKLGWQADKYAGLVTTTRAKAAKVRAEQQRAAAVRLTPSKK